MIKSVGFAFATSEATEKIPQTEKIDSKSHFIDEF